MLVVSMFALVLHLWYYASVNHESHSLSLTSESKSKQLQMNGLIKFSRAPDSPIHDSQDVLVAKSLNINHTVVTRNSSKLDFDKIDNLNLPHHGYYTAHKIEVKDIFITVKTTAKHHLDRIQIIIKTWYLLARDQVSLILVFVCPRSSNFNVYNRD